MTPLRHHDASDEERVEDRTKPLLQNLTSGTKTSDDEPNYSAREELVGGERKKKTLLAASDDPLSHGMDKMPRCPMSAYNHFFQFEQQLLIHELVSSRNLSSSSSSSTVGSLRSLSSRASAVSNADGCLESFVRNLPARYQPVAERIHQRHCEDELMRNMGFLELSRNIAERWRMLDEETKQFFVEKANDDMLRYRLEWKDYTVRQLSLGRKCLLENDDDDESDVLEGNAPDSLIPPPPPRRPPSSSSSSSSPLVIVADTVKSDSVPNACQETTLLRRVSSGCNSLDVEGHAILSSATSAARRTTGNSSTEDLPASTDADAMTGGINAHNFLNRDGFDGGNYPHHSLANATNQYHVRHVGRTHMRHSPRISDMKRNATKQTPFKDNPPFGKWSQESRQVPQHCRTLQHPNFHHRAGVVWEGYHHQMREGMFPNQPYQRTVSNKKLTLPLEGADQGYMPSDSRSSYVDQHFNTRAWENQLALQQSREQKESVLNVPPPPLHHNSHHDKNTSVSSSVTTCKIEFEPEKKIDMQSSAVVDCRPGLAYLAAVAQSQFKRCEDQSVNKKSNVEKGNKEGKKHLEKEKQSSCQQDTMKKKKKEDQASFTEGCAVQEESRKRKCPPKEENSNGTGKILQKPIKPPSAYNLFFQLERDRLLESTPEPTSIGTKKQGRFPVVSNVPYHMMKDDPRVPKRFRQLVQKRAATTPEVAPLDPSKKPRRRHRKTHGKFGFIELSKLIASEWKSSDQETKNFFNSISQTLKSRYYLEIAAYKKQQLMLRKTESKPSDS